MTFRYKEQRGVSLLLTLWASIILIHVAASSTGGSVTPVLHASNLMSNGSANDPTSSSASSSTATSTRPLRVAYQGEPGAYSEKATRELLGSNVLAEGRHNFESCFRAVVSGEVDYACLPVENSLGGSIHENFDLMLRYDLTIVAEHEFRVHHCLLVKPGVKKEQIKYAISHPQALAQCDVYLRGLGITPVPSYDTAGSAKMIADAVEANGDGKTPNKETAQGDNSKKKDRRKLPRDCTPENTAAIASDLAGKTYGLTCLAEGIEDDDTNFTRFLLLGREGIVQYMSKGMPAKTSIVFTLPDQSGALYKALACFSLRDVDCSKIESRPTSASLLNFLKFRSSARLDGKRARTDTKLPRFRYCFYLDFLANELDEGSQNALHHLREQADFFRVLGSYPQKSRLVGPVQSAVEGMKKMKHLSREDVSAEGKEAVVGRNKLNVGIIGYGAFGRFLADKFVKRHTVSCIDVLDRSKEASEDGVEYYPSFDTSSFLDGLDVVLLSVPQIEFESMLSSLPADLLSGKLIVDVCPLSAHTKSVLLKSLPADADIICSNPLFGPSSASASSSWDGLPMVYEKVRVADTTRADAFLSVFERARCQMVEMAAEQIQSFTADAAFVTHLTGRLLDRKVLPPALVMSNEYAALLDVADMTKSDSFDVFYGLYKFHDNSKKLLGAIRENLAKIERQLAAKEAYLTAKAEMQKSDRQRLIAECKLLLEEVVKGSNLGGNSNAGSNDKGGEKDGASVKT